MAQRPGALGEPVSSSWGIILELALLSFRKQQTPEPPWRFSVCSARTPAPAENPPRVNGFLLENFQIVFICVYIICFLQLCVWIILLLGLI